MKSSKIRAWLVLREITQTEIARELGVSRAMVSLFISGQVSSRRLYEYFLGLGVPRSYFGGKYKDEQQTEAA